MLINVVLRTQVRNRMYTVYHDSIPITRYEPTTHNLERTLKFCLQYKIVRKVYKEAEF
jgi:hypothetical protein